MVQKIPSELRKEYTKYSLGTKDITNNPIELFEKWLNIAIKLNVNEPNAMVLSTVDITGRPKSRVVLLKDIINGELIFFTNYNSAKGEQIANSQFGAINFFYPELERQIRIEGIIEKTDDKISDDYFYSRPLKSQVSAIISPQSKIIENREMLENKADELLKKKTEIRRPPNWGGYSFKPNYFEFWQGRENRLHDRIVYELKDMKWSILRIAP